MSTPSRSKAIATPTKYVKVFIGRFQPFHNGHLKVLRAAIDTSNLVVVVIGSAQESYTLKNPWDARSRETMILGALTAKERKKVAIVRQWDMYDDKKWVASVRSRVTFQATAAFGNQVKVHYSLVGCHKGADTYYLSLYKGWSLDLIPQNEALNATDIRSSLFAEQWRFKNNLNSFWEKNVPGSTYGYIMAWRSFDWPNYRCLLDQYREAKRVR